MPFFGPRPGESESGTSIAKRLGIRRRSQMNKGELPTRSAVGLTWEVVTDMREMTTRSGRYDAAPDSVVVAP
jgi:hypothetical protein